MSPKVKYKEDVKQNELFSGTNKTQAATSGAADVSQAHRPPY